MSFRYALYNEDDFAGYVNTSPYKGYETGQTNVDNHVTYSLTHTFSPSLVSQTRLSFNRLNNQQPLGSVPPTPTLYMNAGGAIALAGQDISFPGYSEYSPGNAIPFGGPQNFGIVSEDVTKVIGRHNIRFGGQFTYMQDNRTFGAYEEAVEALGSNTGNAMDNFLNGQLHEFEAAVNPQGKYPGGTVNSAGGSAELLAQQPLQRVRALRAGQLQGDFAPDSQLRPALGILRRAAQQERLRSIRTSCFPGPTTSPICRN